MYSQAPLPGADILTKSVLLLMLKKKIASESIVEPNYDTLKWLSVYRVYPIDMLISSARMPTAEVDSTGARALVLVHSRLTVSDGAPFSI